VRVYSLEEYDISELINEALVVFVVGTTGNGDFPSSALAFWRFILRSDLPDDILSDVTIATFGLGDSSYKRFCWPIRKINKRLRTLGAAELIEGGEGDDQHYLGIEGSLRPWLDRFWKTFEELMPESDIEAIAEDAVLPPEIYIETDASSCLTNQMDSPAIESGWHWATIRKNERITDKSHWQDVRLLAFETDNECAYRATDVLSILPENAPEDVERLIKRLGWQKEADMPLRFVPCTSSTIIPQRLLVERCITLRRLLTAYIDFNAVPRPSFFERILPFSPADHMQREKLQEFTTPGEGADDMYEYAIRVRRTMLEVLDEFDSVQIPLAHVLDVFPLLRKRDFSIASAPQPGNSKVELAVAIVDYKTRLKDRRKGVCTSYLSRLEEGKRLPVQVSSSVLPTEALRTHDLPAIFVGPGTGIAPIRSAIWTRYLAIGNAMRADDNLCFFGCRNRAKDFLFQDEWMHLQQEHCIEFHLAASRDQDEKVYVQDLIASQADRVWDIVGVRHGLVYVCGSAGKMPQAVRDAIVEICKKYCNEGEEKAEEIVNQMERQGRWIEECWE
jgi:sulfite reductase alpha subunit-like flavoprotein